MGENIFGKLGELRKEYFPTRKELEEKKRLEEEKRIEEKRIQDEEERRRKEEKKDQAEAERERLKEERQMKKEQEREKERERKRAVQDKQKQKRARLTKARKKWLGQLDGEPSPEDQKVFNQKQLAEEELFNLKNDYKCLIRQKNQLLTKNDKLNTLTKELENLRLKKREVMDDSGSILGFPAKAYRRFYGRKIEEVRAEIREILIKMRKQDKEIGEKIKITESKIEQLENDLSSDKFMTNQEIKKKLLKEEKDKLRIERLRSEARKELFEKEFQAIPEDDKIRFISDEVKEFVWRRDQAKCVKCGSQDSLEFDHIIPFSRGGSNTARNIQLLCEKCNRSKHDNI